MGNYHFWFRGCLTAGLTQSRVDGAGQVGVLVQGLNTHTALMTVIEAEHIATLKLSIIQHKKIWKVCVIPQRSTLVKRNSKRPKLRGKEKSEMNSVQW